MLQSNRILHHITNDLLQDTQLLPSRKFELVNGICDGMTMLHSSGILHLDLKPKNVLISENGVPWVTDFGLAIVTSSLTGFGSTKGRGTLQYKAPEHFIDDSDSDSDNDSNDNETKVSPKSTYDKPADVYSFGIMCWEIFSGDVPFAAWAGKMDIKINKMHGKALDGGKVKRPPLDAIPSEMIPLIEACWAQDPATRPTFVEIKEMLDTVTLVDPKMTRQKVCFSYRSIDQAIVLKAKKGLEVLGYDVFWGKDVVAMPDQDWFTQWCIECDKADFCVNFLSSNGSDKGLSYTQSQACVNEWMYAGASATPVLNIMIGGSKSRNVILKLPLEGVGAMAFPGARIKSYFINGFQAPSLYIEPLDCELKVAGAELTKMIDSELQAFSKRLDDAEEGPLELNTNNAILSTTTSTSTLTSNSTSSETKSITSISTIIPTNIDTDKNIESDSSLFDTSPPKAPSSSVGKPPPPRGPLGGPLVRAATRALDDFEEAEQRRNELLTKATDVLNPETDSNLSDSLDGSSSSLSMSFDNLSGDEDTDTTTEERKENATSSGEMKTNSVRSV
jgi:serine/threonine protein kinase